MKIPFDLLPAAERDVVGFGTNAIDYLIRLPSMPEFASKVELRDWILAPGGEIATTMAGLSRLGLRTAYCGRFGDDAEGRIGVDSLKADGVDTSFAEIKSGARTQVGFIMIDIATGERTVMWKRDAGLSYSAAEAPVEAVASAKVLHLTPHDAAACIVMAREAKRLGTVVSADVDNIFDGIDELLPLVDILITSEALPERLTGIADHRDALAAMQAKYGNAIVGLTQGTRGSLIRCGGEFVEWDAFEVPGGCKDTTGAGDAFRVGFLYGVLSGFDIERSSQYDNAAAALKCRKLGARTALPTLAEIQDLIANGSTIG